MKAENKTHYRKVFKSDHLGIADLEDLLEEGKRLIFTVKEVKQQYQVSVAGKKGDFNIAYFEEPIKPLVLNATNSKVLKSFTNSPFVEDWKNIPIELYINRDVKMKGELVGGVRISPTKPFIQKKKPEFSTANFEKAKLAGASIDKIKEIYSISNETEKEYLNYCSKNS